jgi:hypothetical protein
MGNVMGRWVVLAVVAVGLGAGCAVQDDRRPWFHDPDKDMPEFSASRLGDSWEEDSVASFLRPEEREALRRSGTAGLRASDLDEPAERPADDELLANESDDGMGRAFDKAGKMAVTALGVGVTVGMVVAPYFLF